MRRAIRCARTRKRFAALSKAGNDMKRVFITGASSGLGEGLARRYASGGVTVGLVSRRKEMLDALAYDLESKGARAFVYAGDVADTDWMGDVARRFLDDAGGVDLVVANAGVGIKDRLRQGEAKEVACLIQVNFIGVTNTVVPFVPAMIAQRSGVLCAVSSFAGHRVIPGRTAYSSTKIAVRCFMDGLRMDLDGSGVHAMTICPGFVKTPLTENNPKMMFMIECDEAVSEMMRAIAAKKRTVTFPWQMNLLKEIVARAPESLLKKLVRLATALKKRGSTRKEVS